MNKGKLITVFLMIIFCSHLIDASDRSDATDLMNKCDLNVKTLEVVVKNFGDSKDMADFNNALTLIKQGKVKLAQSKFVESKSKFEEYLKTEFYIYENLSKVYLQRTQELIDKISEDLVDFVNQSGVLKNFNEASQNLANAKLLLNTKNYLGAIQTCRLGKKLVLNNYTLAKKEVPEEYKKDLADISNTIYSE